jgi:hypothetical protein
MLQILRDREQTAELYGSGPVKMFRDRLARKLLKNVWAKWYAVFMQGEYVAKPLKVRGVMVWGGPQSPLACQKFCGVLTRQSNPTCRGEARVSMLNVLRLYVEKLRGDSGSRRAPSSISGRIARRRTWSRDPCTAERVAGAETRLVGSFACKHQAAVLKRYAPKCYR